MGFGDEVANFVITFIVALASYCLPGGPRRRHLTVVLLGKGDSCDYLHGIEDAGGSTLRIVGDSERCRARNRVLPFVGL